MLASFQTQDGTISLQQSPEGRYSVAIGLRTSLALDGYTSAHLGNIWNLPRERVAVITGAAADCPLRTTLVVARSDTGSLHPIGECGDSFAFTRDGNGVAIRQTGVRIPKLWAFRDGTLNGPVIPAASRPARAAPEPPRPAETASDAMSPPAVSAPVGDEVIPVPVGSPGQTRQQP